MAYLFCLQVPASLLPPQHLPLPPAAPLSSWQQKAAAYVVRGGLLLYVPLCTLSAKSKRVLEQSANMHLKVLHHVCICQMLVIAFEVPFQSYIHDKGCAPTAPCTKCTAAQKRKPKQRNYKKLRNACFLAQTLKNYNVLTKNCEIVISHVFLHNTYFS